MKPIYSTAAVILTTCFVVILAGQVKPNLQPPQLGEELILVTDRHEFWPPMTTYGEGLLCAKVAYVHKKNLVNLFVIDAEARPWSLSQVAFVTDPKNAPKRGHYCIRASDRRKLDMPKPTPKPNKEGVF